MPGSDICRSAMDVYICWLSYVMSEAFHRAREVKEQQHRPFLTVLFANGR